MTDLPQNGWRDLAFFTADWPRIQTVLAAETRQILPPAPQRFAALNLTAPDDVRVVILGQDPYPTPGDAMGLAFSVARGQALPRSLRNIYTEMRDDIGAAPVDGDLTHWAAQGVLLLNTALSVPAGSAGGHAKLGWDRLTAEVIQRVSTRPTAFILWGNHAQGYAQYIAPADHLIIRSAHPSPLSARRGFFGSRPFSQVNEWLQARGNARICWQGNDRGLLL
ncbi:uracil-DNA glycosylase [Ketogulonicigenium vulgare]|uniref:Uracil-DNA glycosylase n=1 Tax=Ketogulonicigenium vulgare (strain WSH-001) TaxID=759362 RepID=F9Y3T3_KETVW|nr:uracil-DNA glycosylase [Ketogulonicigenium vulgare]ADO42248.1 uracil-DNA glycosylase [Ketogulonicigenium vulgare Y25]AEM40447.1 Uracil-DNA glycosylase [Ketogulonicigenium vulgare WSH-001]ALJ80634.1 uracil-DNA glycosylase [Ketogulonicigenium vulgare]ANW33451.1 uracil-DNA glycosylase [Ketogulonicigenium vulgare]AOZ54164.1 uracil-DNA glycosylase [Ketogulonicigenium vulgare]